MADPTSDGSIYRFGTFEDRTGAVATFNTGGDINEKGAFFQSLGTNGRTCATCHQADQAFSISRKGVREVYERTHGTDPLFAAVDGANCPTANSRDRSAQSLLLERGLIRIGIYEITGCPDPSNPGETVNYYTSDPGKGLITGLCADVNRGKGSILRGPPTSTTEQRPTWRN